MDGFSPHSRAFLSGRRLCSFAKFSPLGLIAALALCAPAFAESPAAGRNRCASYGSDYVAVSGGEGCVRIGGHVRAEMAHAEAAPSLLGAPAGFARAVADGVNNVSQTFHVHPGVANGDTQLYRR